MTIPEAKNTLWCVNIQGPDDIVSAPDYLTAVRMANAFNAWWVELKSKYPITENGPRMWAVPIEWPYSEGHGEDLTNPENEYQWLRDVILFYPHFGVKVRGLEWTEETYSLEDSEVIGWTADTPFSTYYHIKIEGSGFGAYTDGPAIGVFATEQAAKSAAQDHFERRILSQIEVADGGRAAALEEAVRKHLKWFERFICDQDELNSSTPRKVAQNAQDAAAELRAALSSPDHADAGKSDAVAICKKLAPYLGATEANDWTGLKDDDAISLTVKLRVGDLRTLKAVVTNEADAGKTVEELSVAARDVLAERRRQIEAEGWTPEHDDQWRRGEMATAAVAYIEGIRWKWPWSGKWWKPGDRRRNLVKAAALLHAEIERLDRVASRAPAPQVRPAKKRLPKVPEKRTTRPTEGGRDA